VVSIKVAKPDVRRQCGRPIRPAADDDVRATVGGALQRLHDFKHVEGEFAIR
jgi:hypothetical protein